MKTGEVLENIWPRPRRITPGKASLSLGRPLSLAVRGDADWLKAAAAQAVDALARHAEKMRVNRSG